MKFLYNDLKASILCCDDYPEKDLYFIEESGWMQDVKYQSNRIIFKHKDKYYEIEETRSGSPFTGWYYEELNVDNDGTIYCDEVYKNIIFKEEWNYCKVKSPLEELQDKLNQAESLLSDARSIMNNVHLYDSNIYREIGIFLYGEDEDE